MNQKPVKRSDGIVGKKMLFRILFNGVFIGGVMIIQYLTNFLGVKYYEKASAIFTLFILFQLFNAFNSRELGSNSILKSIAKNKIMVVTFLLVFVLHFIIVQFIPSMFGVYPMSAYSWLKILFASSSIILVSEGYKLIYRKLKHRNPIEKSLTLKINRKEHFPINKI